MTDLGDDCVHGWYGYGGNFCRQKKGLLAPDGKLSSTFTNVDWRKYTLLQDLAKQLNKQINGM